MVLRKMDESPDDDGRHYELSVTLARDGMSRTTAISQAVSIARVLGSIGLGGEVAVTNRKTLEVVFYSVITKG